MPGVTFHIKAMEPEGETLPAQVDSNDSEEDPQAEDSDENCTDDDLYYDDDGDEDIAPFGSSLMRHGSVHIREAVRDVAPTTLARYQTYGSVHIEDIMPTPTEDLERYESSHIDDLARQQGQYIQDSAQVELRTPRSKSKAKSKSKSRSRSKSQKKSSKESKTKSQSKSSSSRKKLGSKPKKTMETKEVSKSSRKSKKKSKTSQQRSATKARQDPPENTLYPSPLEVQQSITISEMKENPSSPYKLYPSKESTMDDPWQSPSELLEQIDHDQFALLEEQRQLLENIDNHPSSKEIESITKGMTKLERDAFLREQKELFEKIAQNDAKLAAMDAQRFKLTNVPRSPSKCSRRKAPKRSSPQSKPRVEECLQTLQIDESILNVMNPYERKIFVEEQQQLMEKIKREKASWEADARFARELAAQQDCLCSIYPSSCAKQDDGTASTCTPSSLGTEESDHSFETPLATSIVDPPVYYK